MSSSHHKSLDALKDKLTDMDERVIDELYGLEPVYHPDELNAERTEPTVFVNVNCPYCAETFETQVDLTAGSFAYVEDCQICCQPIELSIDVNTAGRLTGVIPHRMD